MVAYRAVAAEKVALKIVHKKTTKKLSRAANKLMSFRTRDAKVKTFRSECLAASLEKKAERDRAIER